MFNSQEYKVSRHHMIMKCSTIITQHIQWFMDKVVPDDDEYLANQQDHQDVREVSLLFKEKHFGSEKWTVDVPVTGFANFMPFFSFQRNEIDAEE